MSVAVTVRLDEKVKEQLDVLVEELGMNLSSFFGIYAKQAIREGGIPFRVSTAPARRDVLTDPDATRVLLERVERSERDELLTPEQVLENLTLEEHSA